MTLNSSSSSSSSSSSWPVALPDLPRRAARPEDDEIAALQSLLAADVSVAHMPVVPAEIEERFYRLNNLPDRLLSLFEDVDPADPDEDDLEERAPAAMALIEKNFLLDEFIDAFYERIAPLPARVRVRRPGSAGLACVRGRPALLAIKRVWAADWSFEALVDRLDRTATFAIDERPVLVHGHDAPAAPEQTERVRDRLGRAFRVWTTPEGAVTRVIHPRGARAESSSPAESGSEP